MSEQETPTIAENAKPQPESKPVSGRKKTKNTRKTNKTKKRDSHAGRPKSSFSYWVKAIESNRLRGEQLAYAIRKVEEYEKLKQSRAKADPERANKLRGLLQRAAERQAPAERKVVTEPPAIADAKSEETPIPEPMPVDPAPIEPEGESIAELMAQLNEPRPKKTRGENVAEMVARLRDVPAPERDSSIDERIWAAAFGVRSH